MLFKTYKNQIEITTDNNTNQHFSDERNYTSAIIKQFDEGIYNQIFEKLINKNQTNIAIDIGANIGLFSIYISDLFSKIYSFEPTESHFNIFQNLTQNLTNIIPKNYAISDKSGEQKFFISKDNTTTNSLLNLSEYESNEVLCKSKSLYDFFQEEKFTNVDFVKMDVEGGELKIVMSDDFANASKIIQNFYLETHNIFAEGQNSSSVADILSDRLSKLDFKINRIDGSTIFAEK